MTYLTITAIERENVPEAIRCRVEEDCNLTDFKIEIPFKDFTVHAIGKRFRRIKKKLNITEKYSFTLKTFRKTFATNLVDKEFDGLKIADLLGHTSINTTSKYYLSKKTSSLKEKLDKVNLEVTS